MWRMHPILNTGKWSSSKLALAFKIASRENVFKLTHVLGVWNGWLLSLLFFLYKDNLFLAVRLKGNGIFVLDKDEKGGVHSS